MNAAHAIRRLEEVGFTHQQATGVVEVIQGEVIEKVATRDYVGEQIALVRKELAEQIGAVRQELAEQIGAVRQELAEQSAPCARSWPNRSARCVRKSGPSGKSLSRRRAV
jgi:vacuolar-type H+-ATPase catalytic subunit A/Vma1